MIPSTSDWPIATHFLSLPDRVCYEFYVDIGQLLNTIYPQKKIPEYYERIGLPMALDVIEVSYFF